MWVRAHRPYRSAIPGAIPPWRDEAETDSYLYYAFGEVRGSTGATANPFRFVGRVGCYDEAELALQYLRARWYRAVLGRFAGRDPLRRGPKLYCYARSRPSAFTDPSGRIVRREEILGKEDLAQLRQFLTPPPPESRYGPVGGLYGQFRFVRHPWGPRTHLRCQRRPSGPLDGLVGGCLGSLTGIPEHAWVDMVAAWLVGGPPIGDWLDAEARATGPGQRTGDRRRSHQS